jgi:5-methylcytosine-specific restriction endonuclease McrA
MSKKHTIEFIRGQFEKEGYVLLTKEYVNNKGFLEYICPRGDSGVIKWNNWQQGQRCAACSGNKKMMVTFIREQFKKEKYVLLTEKYINAHQKLEYICPRGHNWSITWDKWQQGKRCKRCRYENNKGSNNPNYNPNLTDEERVSKRDYLKYVGWCQAVKKRDNFTCQVCEKKGGNLISHHLESYNSNPDLRTALDNGVCLCEKCHKNFHHRYGYGNNTREQFEEFMKAGV